MDASSLGPLRSRMRQRTRLVAALGAAALAVSLLCSSREAHAAVRFGVHGGTQFWIPSTSPLTNRQFAGLARAEVMGSLIPWLYLGGYGQVVSNFGDAPVAAGLGLTLGVRPTIPLLPLAPFAYAGIGYTGFPTGPGQLTHWAELSLGAGLTVMMSRNFGFETRVAASKMFFGPDGERQGPFALTGTLGLTLHL